jgi:putative ATP-binding cassette transporter
LKIIPFLASTLKPVKKLLIFSGVLGAIAGICNAGLLGLLNTAVSRIQTINISMILAYLILLLIIFFADTWSQRLFSRLSQNAIFELNINLCNQILATPLRQLEIIGSSKLLTTLTQDINSIGTAALALPILLINCAIVIACFIYLYLLSYKIFIVELFFVFLNFIVFGILGMRAVQNHFERARTIMDKLFGGFQAIVSGTKELKMNQDRKAAFFQNEIEGPASQYRDDITNAMNRFALTQSGWKANFFILIGFILFALPHWSNLDALPLSHAILVSIFLISPLSAITAYYPSISRSITALKKIKKLDLDLSKIDTHPRGEIRVQVNWQKLTLSSLTHVYLQENTNAQFTLGPLNISFHPGELVFIVGRNGTGKSTLAKLIMGLYKPNSGHIFLDDICVDTTNMEWYRQYFSVVFADYYLFDRPYGAAEYNLESRINYYLTLFQLNHNVIYKDNQFSSDNLSDGQRKRLALLTAYIEDRPIYIFDEWTSNQDSVFKEFFYTQLIPKLKQKNKCIIIISHDEEYFSTADRILILKNGKIEESSHQKASSLID